MSSFTSDDYVEVTTIDGQSFQMLKGASTLSNFFEKMDTSESITLPVECTAEVFQRVNEFFAHYLEEPMTKITKPLASNKLSTLVQPWYADFIDGLEMSLLFELTIAANFLGIQTLLELCNAKLASLIKGKSALEIRSIFGITSEYIPPDEEKLREKYKWAEYPDCINPGSLAGEEKK